MSAEHITQTQSGPEVTINYDPTFHGVIEQPALRIIDASNSIRNDESESAGLGRVADFTLAELRPDAEIPPTSGTRSKGFTKSDTEMLRGIGIGTRLTDIENRPPKERIATHNSPKSKERGAQPKSPSSLRARAAFLGASTIAVLGGMYVDSDRVEAVAHHAEAATNSLTQIIQDDTVQAQTDVAPTQEVIQAEAYSWMPEDVKRWQPLMDQIADEVEMPQMVRELWPALIMAESQGDPYAESPAPDYAAGLGQIMPVNQGTLLERAGLDPNSDPFNPGVSLRMSAHLLLEISDRVLRESGPDATPEEQVIQILAGYNAGINDGERAARNGTKLPWETQEYIWRIVGMMNERNLAESQTLQTWVATVDDVAIWGLADFQRTDPTN